MTTIRFKYTKNHKYQCVRCNTEYDDIPMYCETCAAELLKGTKSDDKLPQEYLDLFSPESRGC